MHSTHDDSKLGHIDITMDQNECEVRAEALALYARIYATALTLRATNAPVRYRLIALELAEQVGQLISPNRSDLAPMASAAIDLEEIDQRLSALQGLARSPQAP